MLGGLRRSSSSPRLTGGSPSPSSTPPKSCFISVLGCSGPRKIDEAGVGKSSLCVRFIQPSSERYDAAKPQANESVLSWMDFMEAEISQDHFLYYGSSPRRLPGDKTAVIHVIEQTELLDEASLGRTAFPAHGKYVHRATSRYLHSPGKVAYTKRSNIGVHVRGKQPLPRGLEVRGVSAYLLVYDPTQSDDRKQQQLTLLARLAENLPRELPAALVITKCDLLTDEQLAQAAPEHEELARCLGGLPLIHSSAELGINVDAAFTLLASKAMDTRPGQGPDVLSFNDAKRFRHERVKELERVLSGAIADIANSFEARWHPTYTILRRMPAYKTLTALEGRDAVRKLFLSRLLELKMRELKLDRSTWTYQNEVDPSETSGIHQALLHALDEHPDVSGDASNTSAIYEELEKVTRIRTWPRPNKNCDHRHTVYFPICNHSHCSANRQSSRPSCHGSCPSIHGRPTTLVLGEEFPLDFLEVQQDAEDTTRQSVSPEPVPNDNRPPSRSPVRKAKGLLRQLLTPSSSDSKPRPKSPTKKALTPSKSLPQINIMATDTAAPVSENFAALDIPNYASPASPTAAKSLPYLPIVITPKPDDFTPRHQRSQSACAPAQLQEHLYHILEDRDKSASTNDVAGGEDRSGSASSSRDRAGSLPHSTWYDSTAITTNGGSQLSTLV